MRGLTGRSHLCTDHIRPAGAPATPADINRSGRSSRDENCSPPPSQIRTCGLPASGSSRGVPRRSGRTRHARVMVGLGSGKIASSRLNRAQVMPWFWLLRVSTRYQSFLTSRAKLAIDRMLLGSP